MTKIFYEQDGDLTLLQEKTIAVIGYGSQGHAQAQNLRDSGLKVIIGELSGSKQWLEAANNGFAVFIAKEAAEKADVIQMLTPDEVQGEIFKKDIGPHLTAGKALVFSHGFNIHFGQIIPPANVDVFMVAPKSPGHLLRRFFVQGKGVPALLAVAQDFTGNAHKLGLAYARGIGCAKAGVIETTFKEETETDLFGEQTVLCGGTTALVKAGFEILVEAGYQPEIAYFECLNELKLIVDLMFEGGLTTMRNSVSDTAQYGDMVVGPRIISDEVRTEMKKVLAEIQSGQFAKEWILENQANRPTFKALAKQDEEHLIEKVGKNLRDMMPWD